MPPIIPCIVGKWLLKVNGNVILEDDVASGAIGWSDGGCWGKEPPGSHRVFWILVCRVCLVLSWRKIWGGVKWKRWNVRHRGVVLLERLKLTPTITLFFLFPPLFCEEPEALVEKLSRESVLLDVDRLESFETERGGFGFLYRASNLDF